MPEGWRIRGLDAVGDLEAVAALFAARDREETGRIELTPEELAHDWRNADFDAERDAWVVEDGDGAVVAYGDVFPAEANLVAEIVVRSGAPRGVVEELLGRAVARAAGRTLVVAVPAGLARAGPLRDAGFSVGRVFLRMGIDLDARRPAPDLPSGLEIRPFDRDAHARSVKEVIDVAFEGHYGYQVEPLEKWLDEHLGSPYFRDETMVVAWAGGDVAGAALCLDEPDAGWVRHLAVLPGWRGRGLGGALLGAVFDRFDALGQVRVELGVDTENATNAARLYERVGMATVRHIELWERKA